MSMPLTQQEPPAVTIPQQYNKAHSSHGSVGPLVAVLVVILILVVVAGMIGRLCSGKRILGYGQYDMESWADRKFSSCIDGTLSPPLPRPPPILSDSFVSTHQETEQEDAQHSSSNQPTAHVDSQQ